MKNMETINGIVSSEKIGKYTINIEYDNDMSCYNPLLNKQECLFGTLTTFTRDYNLSTLDSNFTQDELTDYLKRSDIISLPIYMYDHSGITINTTGFNCSWDSGKIGYIHITKDEIYKEFEVKRISKNILKRVYDNLVSTVEYIDDYITGNVFEYFIIDENNDVAGSLNGFIGDSKFCLEYAREKVKAFIKKDELTNTNN